MRYFNWKWNYFAPIMVWTAICLLPICISAKWWESFLSRVPVAITISVAAVAFVLFLKEIKTRKYSNKRGWILCWQLITLQKYGKFVALEDITLEFTRGVYGLLSPNGGGKTTLIKMLVTLLFPTCGEILWEGIEITKLGEQYRDIIGYLPQDFGYYKNQTPRQFLNYLAALKGIDRNDAERRATEFLQLVSLGDVMDKKCGNSQAA